MNKLILKLYDFFKLHRGLMITVLAVLTVLLGLLVSRINYKEDITDFLPLDGNKQEAMRMFKNLSGANRIIAIVGMKDTTKSNPDRIADATDAFINEINTEKVGGADAKKVKTTYTVDLDAVSDVSDFVYKNIPYFLTESDYERMDSLLGQPDYIGRQLNSDMEELMFPSGGMLSNNISRDPLNFFTPTVEKLSNTSSSLNYELYNGHIFTPDMKSAVVIIESPYGSSETEQNGSLISQLENCSGKVKSQYKDIDIRLTGGPVIAVGNASQIKSDSILTITIAVVLILVLLIVSFRNVRNIILIALTIAWGWLFALGCLSIVHDTVSLIVIGVSSIIIGIAVNYPLHLVAHLNHTPDMRQALKEIVEPLLVGNITTIGAFLALVPLKSIALRDLGLFAAFLLIGTILFVFAFLPHFVKVSAAPRQSFITRLGNIQLENKPWLVAIVAVLTIVFAFFSLRTSFDSNISHINYMTDEQKADMNYLSSLLKSSPNEKTIYAVASGKTANEALAANERMQPNIAEISKDKDVKSIQQVSQFLPSEKEQKHRLSLWNAFVTKHGDEIRSKLEATGASIGFSSDSFADFYDILSGYYSPEKASYFGQLADGPFRSNVYYDKQNGQYSVLTPIVVNADKAGEISSKLDHELKTGFTFEIGELNSSIANSLSDNFNYIGWACGLIVFFFLWLSFGNIELAALSFLPMAVSWLWILGLMSIFGIQFNIINIILATFIFGQGDDYTIFMTEGCQYEYAYKRKMLSSYKNSIIISALIMFIGMGVLIVAKHPALRSLGEVTVVGMFSVVLVAYLLPRFMFKWVTSKNGSLRKRPLTLKSLLMPRRYPQEVREGESAEYYERYIRDVYYYCGVEIVKNVKAALPHYEGFIHSDAGDKIVVDGGSYGSVALLAAMLNPSKTIIAKSNNDDDAAACRNVACRVAKNIRLGND